MNEYIKELCKGHIPQKLVDEVEFLYGELTSAKDRLKMIDLVGNTNILFDYAEIMECYDLMKSLVTGKCECLEFAKIFPNKLDNLDDDDIHEILKEIPEWCANLLSQETLDSSEKERFVKSVEKLLEEFKGFCAIED